MAALFLSILSPQLGSGLAPFPKPSPCPQQLVSLVPKDGPSSLARRLSITKKVRHATELIPPPIDEDMHEMIKDMGASFSADGVVETFGNDDEAINAAENGVAVMEMSHFGRLRVTGDDRLRFLHNQSTADFLCLKDGEGCETVFVSSTARTIDLATAWAMKRAVILHVSPSMRQSLQILLNKYIFFADKVEIEDITDKTFFFCVVGPRSDDVLSRLNIDSLIGKPLGTHYHYSVDGTPVTVGVGCGLSLNGYSFMLSTASAGAVWKSVLDAGAIPMGSQAWERLRILQGRPAPGKELIDDYNVLEAGLWRTISLTKGCYIGQETVARLITYSGVKQHLWGVQLEGAVEEGSFVNFEGQKVGRLTSYSIGRNALEHVGLVYIHKKAGGMGSKVDVNGVTGILVKAPYVRNSLS